MYSHPSLPSSPAFPLPIPPPQPSLVHFTCTATLPSPPPQPSLVHFTCTATLPSPPPQPSLVHFTCTATLPSPPIPSSPAFPGPFHIYSHLLFPFPPSTPATPGPVGNMTVTSPSVDQLTVTWTPPTTGGVPTSYNVTINDSSNTLVPIPTSGPLQHTFTNLTKDTLYTVSVVAINCAGSSNGTKGTGSCMSPTGAYGVCSVCVQLLY